MRMIRPILSNSKLAAFVTFPPFPLVRRHVKTRSRIWYFPNVPLNWRIHRKEIKPKHEQTRRNATIILDAITHDMIERDGRNLEPQDKSERMISGKRILTTASLQSVVLPNGRAALPAISAA